MNHRFNKRRSCSDEGIGDPNRVTLNIPNGQSGSRSSGKHNTNLRQARMIYPFYMVPQGSMPVNGQNNYISPQVCQPSLPQPFVTDNSICFTLLPFRNDLNYQFPFHLRPGQRFYATSGLPMPIMFPLSFALNGIPFINVKLPIDLTGAIQDGTNFISFQPISAPQPIYMAICLQQTQINDLVEKVINELPHAIPPSSAQINSGILPFPSTTDIISGGPINQPCRGASCTHIQCFDLKAYLEKAVNENSWICPICGTMLPFENLRFDPSFYDTISQMQQQQAQQMQQMMQQQQNFMGESMPPMNFGNPMNNSFFNGPDERPNRPFNFGINTPMSAPSQMQVQLQMSSLVTESGSMSTQSDDNNNNNQNPIPPPSPIQQPIGPSPQIAQENSIFDDLSASLDQYNDDFGFNFY